MENAGYKCDVKCILNNKGEGKFETGFIIDEEFTFEVISMGNMKISQKSFM